MKSLAQQHIDATTARGITDEVIGFLDEAMLKDKTISNADIAAIIHKLFSIQELMTCGNCAEWCKTNTEDAT